MIPIISAREKELTDAGSKKRGGKKKGPAEFPIIPELELESFQPPEPPQDLRTRSVRFGWIGAGRCGGRLVETFGKLGYGKTLAVDTDPDDLKALDLPRGQKFLIDTGQEGRSNDIAVGRGAVEACGHDLFGRMEEVFNEDVDHLMICLGAGGVTGGSSAGGLIELATSYTRLLRLPKSHQRVGVLMALPSGNAARSRQAAANAAQAVRQITQLAGQKRICPLVLIDNHMIKRLFPRLVRNYWPTVNHSVCELFDAFNRLSCSPSPYASFDSMDYVQMLAAGGYMTMSAAEVPEDGGKRDISQAIRQSLKTGLLSGDYDLCKAKAAACVVVGGRRIMAEAKGLQDSINYGFDFLAAVTGRAIVHRGIYEDDTDSLRIYTILGGLPAPQRRLKKFKS